MRRANRSGSVYKLSGKRRKPWALRVYAGIDEETGKPIRPIYGTYATQREALAAAESLDADNASLDNINITLAEVYKMWLKNYLTLNKSAAAITAHETSYNHLKKLHDKKFRDLRTSDYENVINTIESGGYTTRRKVRSTLNLMYDYVIRNSIMPIKKYSEFIELNKEQKMTYKHDIFTPDEMRAINQLYIEQGEGGDQTPADIMILLYTGMRISEMLNVKLSDINLDERYLIGGMKTAAGKDRIIPINKVILPIIKSRTKNNAEFLCETPAHKKMTYSSYRDNYWDKLMKARKMEHTPHDTRHTCATLLDKYGAGKSVIKLILGHRIGDITDRYYIHKNLADLLAAIDLLPPTQNI